MPIPTPIMPGAGFNELMYRGQALAQLRILKQQMQLGRLKIGSRTVDLGNGVTCFCNICFNLEEVYVRIPTTSVVAEITGIILNPRSGSIINISYLEYFVDDLGTSYSVTKTTKGVVGGWGYGKNILASAYPYPLSDSDNASFVLGEKVAAFVQPGNYGNLYWSNDAAPFRRLSWKGTPTRHARLPSNINLPGLSIIERTFSDLAGDRHDFTSFGTSLYQGGSAVALAPQYSWPAGNSLSRCLILGAAQNANGVTFIVTQNDHYGKPDNVGGFFIGVWSDVVSGSPDNIRIDGWELLLEVEHTRTGLPWFGNSTGTAFVCGNGDSVLINYVASTPPAISASYTAYTQPAGTQSQTLDGENRRDVAFSASATGQKYFYEYNKDVKVSSVASISLLVKSVVGQGEWGAPTISPGLPGNSGHTYQEFTDTSVDTYALSEYCYVPTYAPGSGVGLPEYPSNHNLQEYEVASGGPCVGVDWLGQVVWNYSAGTIKTCRYAGSLVSWEGDLPGTEHTINTDFTINVCGINIPVVRTTRSFKAFRTPHESQAANLAGCVKAWIGESCDTQRSTIHYLDQRYGVCLYKTIRSVINLPLKQSQEVDPYVAYGLLTRSATIIIRPEDYEATTTETWHLVIDGIDSVIAETTLELFPFGEPMHNDYYEDVCRVFTMPKVPASTAVAPSSPANPTNAAAGDFGAYEDGYDNPFGEQAEADGGVDYFYPEWCRSLPEDPIWKDVAASRYGFTQPGNESPASGTSSYTPPEVLVEPIPSGSFVRHPVLGDLYQFLISKFDGNNVVITSNDINDKIDIELAKNSLATHDTTLYYPISII